jgi:GNAT superfamily N-acetyltransferase
VIMAAARNSTNNGIDPSVENDHLNALFAAAWPEHSPRDFEPVLRHSLAYVCAWDGPHLVGFVNLAWDGGLHGFILDTTVHPDWQRRGIGRQLVLHAATVAREDNLEWLHVDYESKLQSFYRSCGFVDCPAGLLRVASD